MPASFAMLTLSFRTCICAPARKCPCRALLRCIGRYGSNRGCSRGGRWSPARVSEGPRKAAGGSSSKQAATARWAATVKGQVALCPASMRTFASAEGLHRFASSGTKTSSEKRQTDRRGGLSCYDMWWEHAHFQNMAIKMMRRASSVSDRR